ncbi:guanylate kinase [Dokdonella fugitiva]|jgi:guanylate kinase|uniref:Guanylate kinase n=1 Tax=Dokdonella fugitiva TaxID=328517 RepID=A0A4R2I2I6_9GAMM|nr:guanylate kinase [Dokdonella fugitiva]MBA8884688.1 guanylate kinase [Dokdonella fugitiva]TCO37729.1 guanylate kinase [Dokdonella fugitiva]
MSGCLYIVAAPSGAGKSSLVNALLEREPGIALSISHTTRPPRPNDRDGEHYHFVNRGVFEKMVADGLFLEHAEVFGNCYGTSRAAVEPLLAQGRDVLLEIDWQGARQVRAAMPGCVSVFILPPSRAELERRLRSRGSDDAPTIARRLAESREEVAHAGDFDYIVVNDQFGDALADLRAIVACQRLRREAQAVRQAALIADLLKAD